MVLVWALLPHQQLQSTACGDLITLQNLWCFRLVALKQGVTPPWKCLYKVFADALRTFLHHQDTIQQLRGMHPDGQAIQQTLRKHMHPAHFLLPEQALKTGATLVDKNPFQTTLTSQPPLYLPCITLAETSHAQIHLGKPLYYLQAHPSEFPGTMCSHMLSTTISLAPHRPSAFAKSLLRKFNPLFSILVLPQNFPYFCSE